MNCMTTQNMIKNKKGFELTRNPEGKELYIKL